MNKLVAYVLIALMTSACAGAHYCPSYGKRSVVKPTTYKAKKPND